MEHASGNRPRGGVEVLHLAGIYAMFFKIQRKRYCIVKCAPRVARHKIWHKVLLFAELFIYFVKFFRKTVVDAVLRFPHVF